MRMQSSLKPVITLRELRRYNAKCLGLGMLYFLGSCAVAGVIALLGWCVWGMMTGEMSLQTLSWRGQLFISVFTVLILRWGWRKSRDESEIWARFQQDNAIDPGVRITRKMEQGMMGAGNGLITYVLLAPRWLRQSMREWSSLISLRESTAEALEHVRRHLAARETWEPIAEFQHYDAELEQLAQLEMVSLREHLGEWYVRVSLAGQISHDYPVSEEVEV